MSKNHKGPSQIHSYLALDFLYKAVLLLCYGFYRVMNAKISLIIET